MKLLLRTLLLIFTGLQFSFAQTSPGPVEQKLIDSLCIDMGKIDLSKITTKKEAHDAFMKCFMNHVDKLVDIAAEHHVEITDKAAMQQIGVGIGAHLLKQKCPAFLKLSLLMADKKGETTEETNSLQALLNV